MKVLNISNTVFQYKKKSKTRKYEQNETNATSLKTNSLNPIGLNFKGYIPQIPNKFSFPGVNRSFFKLPESCFPDIYQLKAAYHLNKNESVLVTAPTGTGKTAIGHFVISKNMEEGKKTFYTTPLKALSNQKYLDFQGLFGKENVGIITGDVKENQNKPIIVMTTEVYNNLALSNYFVENPNSGIMHNLGTVILDELHYMGDPDRGATWESSIIFTPSEVQILGLSATIGNAEKIRDWIKTTDVRRQNIHLENVPPEKRHVPLEYHFYDKDTKTIIPMNPTSQKNTTIRTNINTENIEDLEDIKFALYSKDFAEIVRILKNSDKIPAIFFIFSKRKVNDVMNDIYKISLTTNEEKKQIEEIYKIHKEKNFGYLGSNLNYTALLNGYAVHTSGILPSQKELVEELFKKKLIKIVFATETLAAGINMPAKTVLISNVTKPSKDGIRLINVNEAQQIGGRAGRRGIDEIGYVIYPSISNEANGYIQDLITSPPLQIESQFKTDYSLLINFHSIFENPEDIGEILNKTYKNYSDKKQNGDSHIELKNQYLGKLNILKSLNYIEKTDENSYKTNEKGNLLQNIIGYPQIPIVETFLDEKILSASSLDLIAFASSFMKGNSIENTKNEEEFDDLDLTEKEKYLSLKESTFNTSLHTLIQYTTNHYDKLKHFTTDGFSENLTPTENLEERIFEDSNVDYYIKKAEKIGNNIKHLEKENNITELTETEKNSQLSSVLYILGYLNENAKEEDNYYINNWKLVSKDYLSVNDIAQQIPDEGTLFLQTTQTISLLNQMKNLCDAISMSKTLTNNNEGYNELKKKIENAISLLSLPPVVQKTN